MREGHAWLRFVCQSCVTLKDPSRPIHALVPGVDFLSLDVPESSLTRGSDEAAGLGSGSCSGPAGF